ATCAPGSEPADWTSTRRPSLSRSGRSDPRRAARPAVPPCLTGPLARGAGVFSYPAFVRLWISDTTKWLGVFTSGLALQLLLIEALGADQVELGLVKSAQWLPMLLFGLVAGVLIDRVR